MKNTIQHNGYVYITALVSMAQGKSLKREWTYCKSNNIKKSSFK